MQVRVAALLLGLSASLIHAAAFEWPPGAYDPMVPKPEAFLGYALGERITSPAEVVGYIRALTAAVPERTQLVEYARSWEGRPLYYLVIGSVQQLERFDEIRATSARLADPRGLSADELDAVIDKQPAVVWLGYGVHGNEISSSDAALATAYYLLAHPSADRLFEDVVVIIDPLQNPDGRNRFVQHHRSLAGIQPSGARIAAQRQERWPSGRFNHYLFDLNRDWFALTQPEVRGRVAAFLENFPQVYVDLHEMYADSTYYFPPAAVPYNPLLSDGQAGLQRRLGQAIASAFDEQGFRYFNREVYDLYYPGYGDTWPALNGAVGMTFEMASARGLIANRQDGTRLTYVDGVQRHFTAGMATIRASASMRQALLREFVAAREGTSTDYVLPRTGNVDAVDALVERLLAQGIEVRRVLDSRRICGAERPAGSYIVSGDQPSGRLVQTLLAEDTPLSDEFWAEQERRAKKHLPLQIYDTIAWSLPHLSGVEVHACGISGSPGEPITGVDSARATPTEAQVAYLIPWGSPKAARFLAEALQAGLVVEAGDRGFTMAGEEYVAGTLMVRTGANNGDLHDQVSQIARSSGADVITVDSSWVDDGVSFGSEYVHRYHAPNVAVVWGPPVQPMSAGSVRYVLEQKFGYPATPVWISDLDSPYVDEFDVLIVPQGREYRKIVSERAKNNLNRWVHQGGVLITIGGAIDLVNSAPLALMDTNAERLAGKDAVPEDDKSKDGEAEPRKLVEGLLLEEGDSLEQALAPEEEKPPTVLGAILNADVDTEHWLANGLPSDLQFIVGGDSVYTPLRRDKGVNVVSFTDAEDLKAAGYLWDASRAQLAHKPVVMVAEAGRGVVIGFTADPTFRGYMDGLDILVANAVFAGAAHSRPVRRPTQH